MYVCIVNSIMVKIRMSLFEVYTAKKFEESSPFRFHNNLVLIVNDEMCFSKKRINNFSFGMLNEILSFSKPIVGI